MHPLRSRYCRAFTLIELSIVLVFVSLIVSFGMQAVQTTGATDCYAVTRKQMVEINSAFTRYLSRNTGTGQVALPMPAGRGLAMTDPLYGKSSIANSVDANGLYYGALPFSTLGLPSSFAADCWGNKFTYAVTKVLTLPGVAAGQYSDLNSRGTIIINTGTIGAPKPVYTQAGYVVISHGADGATKGAAPRNGSKNWCTLAVNDPPDKENCDTVNATFYAAPFNSGSTSSAYFDDIIIYGSKGGPTGMAGINNGVGGIGAACVAGTITWGNGLCTSDNAVPTLLSGQTANVTSTSPTGSATVTCTNGALVATGACGTPCAGGGTLNWGGSCSLSGAPALEGGTSAGPFPNTTAGFTGSATTVSCDGATGTLSVTSGTCFANCPADTKDWSQGGNNCAGSSAEVNGDGSTSVVANTNSGLTGQGTFTCTNGVPSATSGTCAPATGSCPAGTVAQWGPGNNCRHVFASENPNGWSLANVASATSGYTGSATVTCNGSTGQYTITNATCGQDCPARAFNRAAVTTIYGGQSGTNQVPDRCGYDVPLLKFNTSITITNNQASPPSFNANQLGQSTFTCDGASGTIPTQSNRGCSGTPLLACWGGNSLGQLGDGTTIDTRRRASTRSPVGATAISQIVATRNYTCAVVSAGTLGVFCWGGNMNGEFGINPSTSAAYAVGASFTLPQMLSLPPGSTTISQISAANGMLCVIDNRGFAFCQGRNNYGALGDDSPANTDSASNISNGWQRVHTSTVTAFSAIATDWFHTCGIASAPAPVSGKVYCWGNNSSGQLGNSTNTDSIRPVQVTDVPGNDTYSEIATLGESLSGQPNPSISATCATVATGTNAGRVYCWGDDSLGQLGNDNVSADSTIPVAVFALTDAAATASANVNDYSTGILPYRGLRGGGNRACYIDSATTSRAYCWGDSTNEAIFNRERDNNNLIFAEPLYFATRRDASGGTFSGVLPNGFSMQPARLLNNVTYGQIAVGGTTTCMRVGNKIFCGGGNDLWQVGNGSPASANQSIALPADAVNTNSGSDLLTAASDAANTRTIAITGNHGCAILQ